MKAQWDEECADNCSSYVLDHVLRFLFKAFFLPVSLGSIQAGENVPFRLLHASSWIAVKFEVVVLDFIFMFYINLKAKSLPQLILI